MSFLTSNAYRFIIATARSSRKFRFARLLRDGFLTAFAGWPGRTAALSWHQLAGNAMKRLSLIVTLLLGGILLPSMQPALAADGVAGRDLPPFPRSERAASVWAAGACWSECGAYCAWGLAGCLARDAQGHCLKLTDACDRYCQRECRSSGGPLLPITELP
jgi:hypothetical protein